MEVSYESLLLTYLLGTLATIIAGVSASLFSWKRGVRVPRGACNFVLVSSLFLLVAQLLKFYANKNYADFAVWCEIVNNISQGVGPWSSLQDSLAPGTGYWFSAHFTPLIYLFAIPFSLLGRPEVLLVTQFLVLLSAVFAVYLYADHWLGSRDQALVFAAVFVLYPTYQYIHLYEFEMLRFSIPLLLFAFYALEKGKMRLYWLCLVLSLLVREEVAITTGLLGIYTVFFMRERRWVGVTTTLISASYFLAITQWIMPSLRTGPVTEHIGAYWFGALGRTMSEVAIGFFTKPDVVLDLISDPVKLANLFMYGLPVLFLPILAWEVLLIGLGNVGLNLLSGSVAHTTYFLYYLSPTIPFIFVALVKAVAKLGARLERASIPRGGKISGTSAVLCGVFAAAVAAHFFFGPSPLDPGTLQYHTCQRPPRAGYRST